MFVPLGVFFPFLLLFPGIFLPFPFGSVLSWSLELLLIPFHPCFVLSPVLGHVGSTIGEKGEKTHS